MDPNNEDTIKNNIKKAMKANNKYLTYNDSDLLFMIKICQGDIDYVMGNNQKIKDKSLQRASFCIACAYSRKIEMIDLIADIFKIDVHNRDYEEGCTNTNYLMFACSRNQNISIIRHLVEHYHIDVNCTGNYGNNCLHGSCAFSDNLEVIKYLIEEKGMNIFKKNNAGKSGFNLATQCKADPKITEYLMMNTSMSLMFQKMTFEEFKKNIILINGHGMGLHNWLNCATGVYGYDKVKSLVEEINPIKLNPDDIIKYNIGDPYKLSFNEFTQIVDSTDECLNSLPLYCTDYTYVQKQRKNIDHSKKDILFKHNNISYYGDRSFIYESILCLKDLKDICTFDEEIVLDGDQPKPHQLVGYD